MEFLKELQSQGMEVTALTNRPSLKVEYGWLYEAYHTLSRSRQIGGMGEYYIPLSEYAAYFSIIGLEDIEQRTFLLHVIAHVDSVLLKDRYDELAKQKA